MSAPAPLGIRRATAVLVAALLPFPALAVSTRSTAIDVTPDGNEIWVVNPDHASVSVLRARTPGAHALLAEIPVGREPWCLDIHPTNGEVWVASSRDDRIDVIDAASRTVIATIDTGFETFGVAFAPSGDVALVTATGADEIRVVDVATRTVIRTLPAYRRPRGIAWRNDSGRAWVSHLMHPEYFGRLTVVDAATWTTTEIEIRQVFGTDHAGYLTCMQNITLAPAPHDSILWVPTHLINSAKGALSGLPLTPTNMFHAVVRPVNVTTGEDLNWNTYFLSDGGTPLSGFPGGTTPVGGPIAVDFRAGRAYVANMHSDDVTVLDQNLLVPTEIETFPAGRAPIGIVTHPDLARAYVANWLSRDVTVINTNQHLVETTAPTTTWEPLTGQVLHGKQLFFTSTGDMSFENRNSCAGCHVLGRSDVRNWDLSQFGGRHIRATKDTRGARFGGPMGWTCSFDEIQDNEWSIRGLMGGAGLVAGEPNPSLGDPNAGLSQDLDDLSFFVGSQTIRPDTPFLAPDGSLTAEADSGRVLFHDPVVGCASCHSGPFWTDSSLETFLRHDVGTGDPADSTTAGGLDTPSLVGVWDSAPYLHNHLAKTLTDVLTTRNPADEHGVTSHLAPDQIGFLVAFMNSLGWPDSTGPAVAAPAPRPAAGETWTSAFPNPFRRETSLRLRLESPAAEVRLDVVDVAGRRVRTLLARALPRGTHVVGWDSRDDDGRPVAPGTYFVRSRVDGRPAPGAKLTVVR